MNEHAQEDVLCKEHGAHTGFGPSFHTACLSPSYLLNNYFQKHGPSYHLWLYNILRISTDVLSFT